jgi:hypothetical protein
MTLENIMSKELKEEYIREAAYFIWEKAGRPNGDGYEFWMQAIKQLSCDDCCKSEAKKSGAKKAAAATVVVKVPAAKTAKAPAKAAKKASVKKIPVQK